MHYLKLTPTEQDILTDRLAVPDALFEVLREDGHEFTYEQVFDAATQLRRTWLVTSELDRLLIADAVDGSTYLVGSLDAVDAGEITRGRFNYIKSASRAIERKLAEIGIEASFPTA